MIKKVIKWIKSCLSSLRIRFFVVMLIAISLGLGIYSSAHLLAYDYIDSVYKNTENQKERERQYIRDLQEFVELNGISSENTAKLSEWARDNKYVYLLIYKNEELFYTSDDQPKPAPEPEDPDSTEPPVDPENPDGTEPPVDPEAPENPDGTEPPVDPETPEGTEPPDDTETPEDPNGTGEDGEENAGGTASDGESEDLESGDNGDKENSAGADKEDDKNENPGGVTVDYPTREELFEYAKKNELHPLELADGTMFASLTEFTEYLYYDIANILSLILGLLFVIVVITLYFQRVTGRIIRLGQDVNKVAEGDMEHKVTLKGNDEISKLSVNVDDMRSSIIENLQKEREALDSNTALITSMSHDIRTPLTVLLGYIDVMQDKAGEDAEMQTYLSKAESTAMRLKKLSDDLFGYFLVFGTNELEIKIESYDAATLIDQMLSEHILLMTESGYDVSLSGFDLSALFGAVVKTDAQKLVRIFDNIFSNIYKYADKSRPVSISVSRKDGLAELVFENFILSDTSKAESNGIGLKTCKKLGEYIGAGFECTSSGETFTVTVTLECHSKSK